MKYMIFNQSKLNKQWEIKALSELGDFTRGKSRHRPRNDPKLFQNGIYPFIQTGDIKEANLYLEHHTENYNEFGLKQSKLWKENTLCITIAANIAETALLKYPMCFPDSVVGFTAYEGISSELFMHYIFTFIKKSIQSAASGSIQDNINIDFLTKLKFRIPSKAEQDKIAAILSALDKKIALNKQINARLEEMAKTLYDYWFVQFDFPDANGKPYKSSGGDMVFDETLKREIPKGWKPFKLSELVTLSTGKEDANFATEQGIYPFFTCSEKILKCDVYSFDTQAILLAGNGTFSVKRFTGRFNAYQRTYVLEPKSKNLYPIVYFVIIDNVIKFTSGSRGSIIKFITRGDIENIDVVLPNDIENMRFSEVLHTYLLQAELLEKQNHQLTQLRDFLLPMLMNGQVSVAE